MDLTTGRPIARILIFSLPLVLGTLFQQLYSFADTMIVGRLLGSMALAEVGTTYSLNFLILGFVQGSCVGFGIPLAQAFGAKDFTDFKRYFFNGTYICLALSVLLTVLTIAFVSPLLHFMQTPEDIFYGAKIYSIIIFLGVTVSVFYNFLSAVLRAAGDSKHPFYFLVFSSFLNIALDFLFVGPMRLGVAGAALATVLSQAASALLNLFWLLKKTSLISFSREFTMISKAHISVTSRIGFPMGFEYCISALGAVIMQGAINLLGSSAIAGQTVGEKIRQMFTLPMESVGMAMATYVGQNKGSGCYDRIRRGIFSGLLIQWSYCLVSWLVIFFGKDFFTSMVLGSPVGAEAEFSIRYLGVISTLFCLHGSLMIMRNTLQGMGHSVSALLSGVGELLGRALGGFLSTGALAFTAIALANPLAWAFALAYCSVMVAWVLKGKK